MKKLLLTILLGLFAFSFVACDSNSNKKPDAGGDDVVDKPDKDDTTTTEKSLEISTMLAIPGTTDDGTIKVMINTTVEADIYYAVVLKDSAAPTDDQIKAGADYNSVVVEAKGSKTNVKTLSATIGDLIADTEYTVYAVASKDNKFSPIKNATAKAFKYVAPIDKGEGTETDPFQISTAEDLLAVGKGTNEIDNKDWTMDAHYVLTADIDLSTEYGSDKKVFPTIGLDDGGERFEGVFDGAGYTISGLYIKQTPTDVTQHVALFAATEQAALIKNLNIDNAYVENLNGYDEAEKDGTVTAVLVGYNKGTIDNVSITNSTVISDGSRVGALVGRSYMYGNLSNIYIDADVTGVTRVAGVVGVVDIADNNTAEQFIEYNNIVVKGNFTGTQYVAGIAGYYRGVRLTNAFIDATIQADKGAGGAVGLYQKRGGNNNVTSLISNVVFNGAVICPQTSHGAVVGERSTSNINDSAPMDTFLPVENLFYVEGTFTNTLDKEGLKCINGEMVTKENLKDTTWLSTNLPKMTSEEGWNLEDATDRLSFHTEDNGLLEEVFIPLKVTFSASAGANPKEILIKASVSRSEYIIYYAVYEASTLEPTVEDLKAGTNALFFGNGETIEKIHVMAEAETEYLVYYFAEGTDESSEIENIDVISCDLGSVTITSSASAGSVDKEIVFEATSDDATATIYYVVTKENISLTGNEIKDSEVSEKILKVGSGKSIDENFVTDEAGVTYYVYFYALGSKLDSEVIVKSTISFTEGVINYGTGTEADPFILRTPEDLAAIASGDYTLGGEEVDFGNDSYYALGNDIDLSTVYSETLNKSWTPLPKFKGSLDGKGFAIKNLYIKGDSATDTGLFSITDKGTRISNLNLVDVNINVNITALSKAVGALAGYAKGNYTNIKVSGNITTTSGIDGNEDFRTGGLFGKVGGGSEVSKFDKLSSSVTIKGLKYAGGVAGYVDYTDTLSDETPDYVMYWTNIVSTANVSGTENVGGIAGQFNCNMQKAVSYATVYASTKNAGGLFGAVGGSSKSGGLAETSVYAPLIKNVFSLTTAITSEGTTGNIMAGLSQTAGRPLPVASNLYKIVVDNIKISDPSALDDGAITVITEANAIDASWHTTNVTGFDFTNVFEIINGKIVLK